jgi:polyisoprenoid-binding protein YceI
MKRLVLACLALSSLAAAPGTAEERLMVLDPAATRIDFHLEATGHDVEGAFGLRHGEIRFDPEAGTLAGEIVVDLAGAKTGNGSRDKTMHQDVLEDAKFPTAVLKLESLDGRLAATGASTVRIRATLDFHGASHPVLLPAKIELAAGRARVDIAFAVPFVEWGLHDPSIFFLRVAKLVQVSVHAEGSVAAPAATTAAVR